MIKSTGDLSCLDLGRQLSSLSFTPQENDYSVGFTCWTSDKANRWNSSDPVQVASLGNSNSESSSVSITSSTSTTPTGVATTSPSPTGASAGSLTSTGASVASTTTKAYVVYCSSDDCVCCTNENVDLRLEGAYRLDL